MPLFLTFWSFKCGFSNVYRRELIITLPRGQVVHWLLRVSTKQSLSFVEIGASRKSFEPVVVVYLKYQRGWIVVRKNLSWCWRKTSRSGDQCKTASTQIRLDDNSYDLVARNYQGSKKDSKLDIRMEKNLKDLVVCLADRPEYLRGMFLLKNHPEGALLSTPSSIADRFWSRYPTIYWSKGFLADYNAQRKCKYIVD